MIQEFVPVAALSLDNASGLNAHFSPRRPVGFSAALEEMAEAVAYRAFLKDSLVMSCPTPCSMSFDFVIWDAMRTVES